MKELTFEKYGGLCDEIIRGRRVVIDDFVWFDGCYFIDCELIFKNPEATSIWLRDCEITGCDINLEWSVFWKMIFGNTGASIELSS